MDGSAGLYPATWAKWSGTFEELEELSNVEELTLDEWREDVEELRAKATNTPMRNFMVYGSIGHLGSTVASKEFALACNGDEPEPAYFEKSATYQKAISGMRWG